jgi:hypothetical protein
MNASQANTLAKILDSEFIRVIRGELFLRPFNPNVCRRDA